MKTLNKTAAIGLFLSFAVTVSAQMISWQIPPQWDSVAMMDGNLIRVSSSGKEGVIDVSGREIIPCAYPIITDVREHRFLVLDDRGTILSMWDDSGHQIPIEGGEYRVDGSWPYFEEGLLAVHNKTGWSYLNTEGTLAIKGGYLSAFPFMCGQAAVCDSKKGWAHIDKNGNRVRINDARLSSKKISFASSFVQTRERPMSLVNIEGVLYMIDTEGTVLSNDLIPKNGQSLYGVHISGPNTAVGDFSVTFNDIRMPVSIVKGANSWSSEYHITTSPAFPSISEIVVLEDKSIRVRSDLTIAPQFQSAIPISNNRILAKKDAKWGILLINQLVDIPKILAADEMSQLKLDHATGVTGSFFLSPASSNTKVYYVDNTGIMTYLELSGKEMNRIPVPMQLSDGILSARIGLVINDIILAPQEYRYSQPSITPAFSVIFPSSVIVSEAGKASTFLTITNTSRVQATAPFLVRVISGKARVGVITLDCEESISIPVDLFIKLGAYDLATRQFTVEIQEEGCRKRSFKSGSIQCSRQLKDD